MNSIFIKINIKMENMTMKNNKQYNKCGQKIRVEPYKKNDHVKTISYLVITIFMYTYIYIEIDKILGA